MNKSLSVALNASADQVEQLSALQSAFAQVCNALAPLVQENRCWNRVTLHHLAYKSLREQFPAIGSQMVCNAIYSVSLTGRLVFQHPASPYHHTRLVGKKLPLLRFSDSSPVYFDRHTLSLKGGILSLYTLDGRIRFALPPQALDEEMFQGQKLRETVLSRRADGVYELMFNFVASQDEDAAPSRRHLPRSAGDVPAYVRVESAA
jgi:hypothetical protein